MTQERFSTLEECCEFATQFCLLTPKKKLEQKDNMVAMHIALARHIDELINCVCTRHDLECQWEWNYGLCWRGSAGRCSSHLCLIRLFPNIVFYGANYIRCVILHELAHLTNPHHRKRFWKTNIAYLQEEELLPEGEVTEEEEVVEDRWGRELKYHSYNASTPQLLNTLNSLSDLPPPNCSTFRPSRNLLSDLALSNA